jgi:hypothetical protein
VELLLDQIHAGVVERHDDMPHVVSISTHGDQLFTLAEGGKDKPQAHLHRFSYKMNRKADSRESKDGILKSEGYISVFRLSSWGFGYVLLVITSL